MITRETLENAAGEFPATKYPEEFYAQYLGVLETCRKATEAVAEAVRYLFLWKLGKVGTKRTRCASPLGHTDRQGR